MMYLTNSCTEGILNAKLILPSMELEKNTHFRILKPSQFFSPEGGQVPVTQLSEAVPFIKPAQ